MYSFAKVENLYWSHLDLDPQSAIELLSSILFAQLLFSDVLISNIKYQQIIISAILVPWFTDCSARIKPL
jgi:hypothetical protein